MTSGQDVSDYLDTLGLVKSYFYKCFEGPQGPFVLGDRSSFFVGEVRTEKKRKLKKNVLVLRRHRG
jgi:hypothetical protein